MKERPFYPCRLGNYSDEEQLGSSPTTPRIFIQGDAGISLASVLTRGKPINVKIIQFSQLEDIAALGLETTISNYPLH